MSETRIRVNMFKVDVYCDECSLKPNPGCILKNTCTFILTEPAKYIYKCPLCEKKFEFDKHYPYLDYEEINEIY